MSAAMVEGWVNQFSKLRERVKPRPRRPAGEEAENEEARKPDSNKKIQSASLCDSTLSEDTVFMLMDRFAPY
ncbi:hypothetical protein QQ045_015071 [Rhodiola kirilowii]